MKKVIKITSILITISFLLLIIQPCFALGRDWKLVIKVKGTVESQKAGQTGWDSIWSSRMLADGDKAKTLDDSRAKVKLADQSIFLIGSNSLVEMSQFKLTPESRIAKFKLLVGKIRVKAEKFLGGKSDFEITTPNCVLAARGTEFYVEQEKISPNPGGDTKMIVFSGSVSVTSKTEHYVVEAGQTAIINTAGSIFVNPAGFMFPGRAAAPPTGDSDLTDPLGSISETRHDLSPPPGPPEPPPIYNPSVTPTPVPTPCPPPCH